MIQTKNVIKIPHEIFLTYYTNSFINASVFKSLRAVLFNRIQSHLISRLVFLFCCETILMKSKVTELVSQKDVRLWKCTKIDWTIRIISRRWRILQSSVQIFSIQLANLLEISHANMVSVVQLESLRHSRLQWLLFLLALLILDPSEWAH